MIGSPICTLAPATSPVVASIVRAGERRTAEAVAARATAEHDDQVAGMRAGGSGAGVGGDADASAVDQRVGGVARVVEHRAGDGRQADLVAVVGDAGDDAASMQPGCSTPSGSCVGGRGRSGPKQRMSVTAIGRCAAPITSRITPPTPVLAPPNGSIAEGWLCVSALTASVRAGGERHDAGVADERAAHERRVDRVGGVAQLAQQRRRRACRRSVVTSARKVLCAQCSLHVWASVSSSTSVGSRPAARKWAAIACSSARSSDRPRSRLSAASASSSRAVTATCSIAVGAADAVAPPSSGASIDQCSMTGLARRRRTRRSSSAGDAVPCTRKRWPDATSTCSPNQAAARCSSAPAVSVTPGRSSTSTTWPPPGSTVCWINGSTTSSWRPELRGAPMA